MVPPVLPPLPRPPVPPLSLPPALPPALPPLPSPAHRAARSGDVERLRRIADHDPDVLRRPCALGLLPVFYAIRHDRVQALEFLVSRGVPLQMGVVDPDPGNPIGVALRHGAWDCLRFLVDRGVPFPADVLRTIYRDAHVDLVRPLLATGKCDVDCRSVKTGTTLFANAVFLREYRFAELLLDHGADITAPTHAVDACTRACDRVLQESSMVPYGFYVKVHAAVAACDKARHLLRARVAGHLASDAASLVHQLAKATGGGGGTASVALGRVVAILRKAPRILLRRVDRGQPLPRVEVEVDATGGCPCHQTQQIRHTVAYTLCHMAPDVFKELVMFMTPYVAVAGDV